MGIAASMMILESCSAGAPEYFGISLQNISHQNSLARLAHRASQGDKRAQLDLGIAFEEGRGLCRDFEKARELYKAAATPSKPKRIWYYQPSAKLGGTGAVAPANATPTALGLPEASIRLKLLERRSERNLSENPKECVSNMNGDNYEF